MSAFIGTLTYFVVWGLMLHLCTYTHGVDSGEQEEVTEFENKYTKEKKVFGDSTVEKTEHVDKGKNDKSFEESDKNIASTDEHLMDSLNAGSSNKGTKRDETVPKDVQENEKHQSDKRTDDVVDGATDLGVVPESTSQSSEEINNNQSYFSLGSIIRKIVDPVFEEFEKTNEMKEAKAEAQNSSDLKNMSNNLNDSLENSTLAEIVPMANKTDRKAKFTCVGKNMTLEGNRTAMVEIINNTRLVNLLSFDENETTSDCVLVLFYAPYCQFCAKLGASYNALARVFPQLEVVAVDAAQFSNLNARFGTVSVPNILLFHESKSAVRFNQTEKSFQTLIEFVKNSTGLNPNMTVNITEKDYVGPLPSVLVETTDYLLWVAWVFVVMCSTFMFVNSNKGQQWINKVKVLWQEHQHID